LSKSAKRSIAQKYHFIKCQLFDKLILCIFKVIPDQLWFCGECSTFGRHRIARQQYQQSGQKWSRCQYQYFLKSIFYKKVFCAALVCLQFEFVIFWWKEIDKKSWHKILMKLTTGRQELLRIQQEARDIRYNLTTISFVPFVIMKS